MEFRTVETFVRGQGFMGIRFRGLVGLAIAAPIVLIGSFANVAQAQQVNQQAEETETIPSAFEDAYYRFDENFYANRRAPRSATWFLGPFPENEIAGDGRAVNNLYREILAQQSADGPTIRSQDLPNPYTDSVMTSPIVPPEEPIPAAFSSPYSRSPVTSGGGGGYNGGGRSSVPALW
jgi:hypothetical protein